MLLILHGVRFFECHELLAEVFADLVPLELLLLLLKK